MRSSLSRVHGPCTRGVQNETQIPSLGFGLWDLTGALTRELPLRLDPVVEVAAVLAAAAQVALVRSLGNFVRARLVRGRARLASLDASVAVARRRGGLAWRRGGLAWRAARSWRCSCRSLLGHG